MRNPGFSYSLGRGLLQISAAGFRSGSVFFNYRARLSIPDFSKLRPDPAGFDRHHDRLDGADLLIRDAFLPGDAKIGLHSRVARSRHCGREVDQQRGLLIEDLVVSGGFVELTKGIVLFFRKHHALLPPVSL